MNQTIQEADKTMINGAELPKVYCKEEFHTTKYTINRILYQRKYGKTCYELWYGTTPTMKYLKVFGRKCYIRRDEDNLENFDSK